MQNSNVESTKNPRNHSIILRDKLVDLSTPRVMGIVNVTPDSFYAGSRIPSQNELLKRVEKMRKEGVFIVDIGGYSTRPGAADISISEEIARVAPAIESIRQHFPELYISVDTFRSSVAEAAIDSGADMLNDISGFQLDPDLLGVLSRHNIAYVLMHMRGTPQTMQNAAQTTYSNLFVEVDAYLREKLDLMMEHDIHNTVIDLGFGFSKTIEQNHFLLRHLDDFHHLEKPLLLGISRKSMIYKKLHIHPDDSLPGTIALNAIGLSKGASILRVHDVKPAFDLIQLLK